MQKYQQLLIITLLTLFTGCINMNDPKHQAEYVRCYNSFDTSLTNFIPKKIPNNYVSMGTAPLDGLGEFGDYAGMHITTKVSDLEEYSELKNMFSKQAKSINNSSDTCLIVISTYGQLEDGVQGIFNCDKPIPVPQYGICEANDSFPLWRRMQDVEIIVIDYEYRDLLNRPVSDLRNDLPEGCSAGYSKGITFNRKNLTIQKWLIIW